MSVTILTVTNCNFLIIIFNSLFKHGADINVLDNDKWSPLTMINADREDLKQNFCSKSFTS